MKKKKILLDMLLNIGSTAVPTFVLQLLILPGLSRTMDDDRYGFLVTVLAFLNVIPATMGNVLNNIRLLHDGSYREKDEQGDFQILLALLSAITTLAVICFLTVYEEGLTPQSLLLSASVSFLWLTREYYIVAFRLKIDYAAILISNLAQVAGYGMGYLLYLATGYWQWIYFIGYTVSMIYILSHSSLWKEPFKLTALFPKTAWQSTLLLFANLLNRLVTYADKILIYPILGGAVVSVYYAATVFGKVVSLLITPVNSVALTYLSRWTRKKDGVFRSVMISGAAVCALGYILCILVSKPVLNILYPQYAVHAMKYIPVTTGTTVLYAMISIVNPFILKFFDMKWQIAINGGTAVLYVILCMGLLHIWGLTGFCAGALLTNILKLVTMILIYCHARSVDHSKMAVKK